ncbi:flavonol 3-sulfotransferase-like [Phalaenopsis equestris]|uniref:flavonol 3-sulfotransferase-like n=1 Tax=Phalaenopsis equestris TaxID=78828 RepID=UPI0009E4BEFF|nr:flavonol 3-sulfotransferase-like [Phalaenopsis equestris]
MATLSSFPESPISLPATINNRNKGEKKMLLSPYFAKCFDSQKTEEQKEDELHAFQQHKKEILTLPLQQGWRHFSLRFYKGFWFAEFILPGVLSLRRHFLPNPSDIFLASYPKSGATLLKALVFVISTRNPDSLLSCHPHDCSPYLEGLFAGPQVPDLDMLPSPRQLATHIPYSVLPESVRESPCRIIYLCREPKDTLVSTYHFFNGMRRPESSQQPMPFMEAMDLFCKGQSIYGPVWEHQMEYWRESQRRPDKVLFLTYEYLKADPETSVRRMAEFMGMRFTAEEEMSCMVGEIVRQTSIEKFSGLEVNKVGMKFEETEWAIKNSSFFRNGRVGDWREHFTAEMAERLDAITKDKLHQLSHSNES